ncbi:MAG: 4Fe-4S binding protein [Lachnospiraceae bacterium]|nr:4Fe-4S binding protein [Lachnospiraceae bacterium]
MEYLRMLVEEFHSTTVATLGEDGYPQTRVIDMMHYEEDGVYFLTARGKAFYQQLMEQKYIAVSATKDKKAISLRGKVKNIGSEKLDVLFEKNPYMKQIYPGETRKALEVFVLYEAQGEFFDISDPAHIVRDDIVIGQVQQVLNGYEVTEACIGCKLCYSVCPQKCIDITAKPVVIDQNHCLHCGNCKEICPKQAVRLRNQKKDKVKV